MLWEYQGVVYESRGQMCQARREHYVELLDQGLNFTQAAQKVGMSKRTGKVWRNGRGRSTGRNEAASVDWYHAGMEKPRDIHPRFLSQEERLTIADMIRAGSSIRAIAQRLGRSASTISREIKKNTHPENGTYEPYYAHQLSHNRLKRPKTAKINKNPILFALVEKYLAKHWSPEQISAILKKKFPGDKAMHMSTETIYQAIYIHARGHLKLDLKQALRTGRTKRKKHGSPQNRQSRFKDPMTMISQRPPEVDQRVIPGHWEGDLIIGKNHQSAIGTLVERTTLFTILLYLPNHHDAGSVQEAIIKKCATYPNSYATL